MDNNTLLLLIVHLKKYLSLLLIVLYVVTFVLCLIGKYWYSLSLVTFSAPCRGTQSL